MLEPEPWFLDSASAERAEADSGPSDHGFVFAQAFAGAESVFWPLPLEPDPSAVQLTRLAGGAMTAQSVRRVVMLGYTRSTHVGLGDELFRNTDVGCRTLQLPFLWDSLLQQIETITHHGTFSLIHAATHPLLAVAAADVAQAAVKLLLDPDWRGQSLVELVNPNVLSPQQMAHTMSEVLGRPVYFQQIDGEACPSASVKPEAAEEPQRIARDQSTCPADPALSRLSVSTSFRQWCQNVLHPAVVASRAGEVRRGFAHLHAVDPVLAALIDKRPDYDADAWRSELPSMDLFGCLLAQIIGQQISLKAARAILERLSAQFGGRVPSAWDVTTLDPQALRDVGLTWRKANTVLDLAARFADGRLSEHGLRTLSDDQIMAELTQISGIGPWTVHGALLISLHRGDVVPVGDILLKNTIKTCYHLDHVPTEQEVTDIAAAWRPYGSLGVNLLFASAELDSAAGSGKS
ncbi:hypothetical protein [Deinococcus sp. Arct2-2]|uniref:hypothetical protein n=1 Tax=Deinococcus sp. Arct2-2 TaxID=2568653 RepID=UPI001454BD2D|nr:hypothetical protein [Deinococcus sp. Arct2-2]